MPPYRYLHLFLIFLTVLSEVDMDYEQILEEQMNNVVEPGQTDSISEEAARLTEGMTDGFTLDKILPLGFEL